MYWQGGDVGLRIWGLGSGCGGFVISTEKGKKRLNWREKKMAPICQGADFCMLKEVMALRSRRRNIDPLISLLFFKLWPTEHKCITNQFNPVILIQLCSFTWCVADTSASPTLESVWPGAQAGAKAPTSEAYWPGRGTPLMAFWHQVQRQWKSFQRHLIDSSTCHYYDIILIQMRVHFFCFLICPQWHFVDGLGQCYE